MATSANVYHQQLAINCKAQFFSIGNQLKRGLFTLKDVGDYVPGNLMVHDINTNTNIYMNKNGCEILQHSREELQELGPEYFKKFFPEEETQFLNISVGKFIAQNDHSKVHSFLQRVRPNEKHPYKWYFTSSRLCCAGEDTATNTIMHLAIEANALNNLNNKLNRVLEENLFISQHYREFNLLTRREKELIRLIALGSSSQDISDLLFISKHTVNNHRKNILGKLQVNSVSQLIRFALAFDLV